MKKRIVALIAPGVDEFIWGDWTEGLVMICSVLQVAVLVYTLGHDTFIQFLCVMWIVFFVLRAWCRWK